MLHRSNDDCARSAAGATVITAMLNGAEARYCGAVMQEARYPTPRFG